MMPRRVAFRSPGDAPAGPRRFLGLVEGVPYFAVTTEPDGTGWQTPREFGARADDLEASLVRQRDRAGAVASAARLLPAVRRADRRGAVRLAADLHADGSQHFPRTDPAVIMLVHDGGDLALLGRGPEWGEGRFSTLAGFVEPGESLEAAVAREVFEEVGVQVRDVRYLASQPWPFPASLMLGFVALLDGDPTLTLDPVEMAEAAWFTRDEVRRAADWVDNPALPIAGKRARPGCAVSPRTSRSPAT